MRELLQKMSLDTVFVATDGTKQGARYQLRAKRNLGDKAIRLMTYAVV